MQTHTESPTVGAVNKSPLAYPHIPRGPIEVQEVCFDATGGLVCAGVHRVAKIDHRTARRIVGEWREWKRGKIAEILAKVRKTRNAIYRAELLARIAAAKNPRWCVLHPIDDPTLAKRFSV